MRALFLIPQQPPPTLKNPKIWPTEFVDFLAKCLIKDYKIRPSASDMLQHPFIKNASGKEILASLVKKCLPDIELLREAKQSDEDEDEDDFVRIAGRNSISFQCHHFCVCYTQSDDDRTMNTSAFDTVRSGLTAYS